LRRRLEDASESSREWERRQNADPIILSGGLRACDEFRDQYARACARGVDLISVCIKRQSGADSDAYRPLTDCRTQCEPRIIIGWIFGWIETHIF